jgi:PAS domain S-box-containing protein
MKKKLRYAIVNHVYFEAKKKSSSMKKIPIGRILIVDDDVDVLKIVRDLIEEFGYEAVGCSSGKEALKLVKKRKYDLLLTDLSLPEMDGIKLMQNVRELAPYVICIMVTGKGTIETAVEAMKVGAFDYILKPLKPEILLTALARGMEVRRLRESEEKYRTIVEDQTEMICRWKPDGTITYANEVYCRYFGKTCNELIGQVFPHIIEEERDMLKGHAAGLNRENPVGMMENRAVMPTGEIRWQHWTNRAILDGRENVVEFQSVGRDITDRKQAEEALHKSREELKERVKELEEFYQLAVGRELRMIELKQELEELKTELGNYKS